MRNREGQGEGREEYTFEWMKRGVSSAHLMVLSFLEKQSALLSAENDHGRQVMWNSRRKVEEEKV